MEWVVDKIQQCIGLSCYEITLKALEFIKSFINAIEFKASYRLAVYFMKRHGISVRRRTTITQHLPDDQEDKLLSFQRVQSRWCKEAVIHARAPFVSMPLGVFHSEGIAPSKVGSGNYSK
ncbi:hypothetical protein NPIL_227411 [Nephila pilipes]|uniref:Uncharacterized protein n=1 Tax=Nephila pilipes TaxID=299642 RepID=A0A8X6TKR0_NEPPI|nr:hypothetical protein NPIL_227411 [Nephila pilipes]